MTDSTEGPPILYSGLDEAIVGLSERACAQPGNEVTVYDFDKCIEIFMKDGTPYEQAIEHMSFNVTGGWVGPKTPIFVHRMTREELDQWADENYPPPDTEEK